MRHAARRAAVCGSMLAIAVAVTTMRPGVLRAQSGARQLAHSGAILVQVTDTAINPLAGQIVFPTLKYSVPTPEEGALLFLNVPDGLYLIQARHIGHRPEWRFARVAGDTVRVEFALMPVSPVRGSRPERDVAEYGILQSRLREFLSRSLVIPSGSFITRAEIERRRARSLVGLLARVADISVDRTTRGPTVIRSQRAAGVQCKDGMLLFVDAVELARGGVDDGLQSAGSEDGDAVGPAHRPDRWFSVGASGSGWDAARRWMTRGGFSPEAASDSRRSDGGGRTSMRRSGPDIDRVRLSTVAGIEVYPTLVGVPPEFRIAGSECGVVLVWTEGT